MEDWSARQYLKFEDERTRPPRDLLAQVPLQRPNLVVDLGCGPGNSTELLAERYPNSQVMGLDSSPDMLRKARERLPNCTFVEADIADWKPDPRTDLIFGNAVMQWLPEHPAIMRRMIEAMPPGGVLAIQMPDNTREPALRFQRETGESGPWKNHPEVKGAARDDLPSPEQYYDLYNNPKIAVSKTTATPALLMLHAPLADYTIGSLVESGWLRRATAGLAGLLLIYAACAATARWLVRRRSA